MIPNMMKNIFFFYLDIFTNSAPLGRVGHRVAMSVVLCVCMSVPSRNTHFRRSCRPLVEDRVPNIGLGWHFFQKKGGSNFLAKFFGGGSKFFLRAILEGGPKSRVKKFSTPPQKNFFGKNFFGKKILEKKILEKKFLEKKILKKFFLENFFLKKFFLGNFFLDFFFF